MTHTKGKWTCEPDGKYHHIKKHGGLYILATVYDGDDVAERICKMNNSYDELLEACKDIDRIAPLVERELKNKKLTDACFKDIHRIAKSAIAKAEL